MEKEFYSNGKLLLSGEYAVLDGALALAIPTKYGQYLRVTPNTSSQISWKSFDEKGNIWFEGRYNASSFDEVSSSDKKTSEVLKNILLASRQLNQSTFSNSKGYAIETELSFPKDWGLGSSSTLINNVAKWAQVNAYKLLSIAFGGSGYDIACAQHDTPILYQINNEIPGVKEVDLKLPFSNQLYFVYLNQKKNSRDAINAYRRRAIDKAILIKRISEITKQMVVCGNISDFKQLMTRHEQLLSKALGIPTIKSELFLDYEGAIKSLGGWGGDFILVTGNDNTPDYFKNKGYQTVISYNEMIL